MGVDYTVVVKAKEVNKFISDLFERKDIAGENRLKQSVKDELDLTSEEPDYYLYIDEAPHNNIVELASCVRYGSQGNDEDMTRLINKLVDYCDWIYVTSDTHASSIGRISEWETAIDTDSDPRKITKPIKSIIKHLGI